MRRLFILAFVSLFAALPALAQDPVPERRLVVTKDVDFYGADLQNLFDTTYEACQRACLTNPSCQAFTFNRRSNACFPKSEVSAREAYEGALSAEVLVTDSRVLGIAGDRASDLAFLGTRTLAAAREQADGIGAAHPAGLWPVDEMLRSAAEQRTRGNNRAAMNWTGGAISKSDASDLWVEYARLSLIVKTSNNSEKRRLRSRSLSAAVNGYLRSLTDPARVAALMQLAATLEASNRGRDMIPALRLAERIQPRSDVIALLESAIGKYGFRITEHRADNNSANPRICAEFSEPLIKAGTDYDPFVRLPEAGMVAQADDRQICIDGLRHGERYTVTFREGLPAANGETLARDVDLTVYVRDRDPAVRFPGRAYVLPRTADAGLPIETVNIDAVDLQLRRVSDRNLLRTIQDGYFGQPLREWQEREFASNVAETIWSGTGEVTLELNRDTTTRLPVGALIADLSPGIYAMTASVPGADPYETPPATQWFLLSDLGMTTMSANDGLHVIVRSLADASAVPGGKVTLLSRANRILGTAQTDSEGYARFDAGLIRGTGGASAALVMVENGETDMAFLSLTDPAFDLSDRGVEGRPPAPPIDVFLATDRGAYRAGETIHATVLARDALAAGLPDLPLTAILSRPDGVEYSRHLSDDDRAGGHVFHLPVAATAPRGTWRLEIKADPDAPSLATRSLLVEDFLPERIDVDLSLPEGLLPPENLPPLEVSARYLFGAPAGDLPIEGEVILRPRQGLDAYPGYRFGRYDTPFRPVTQFLADAGSTDTSGRAEVYLSLPDTEETGRLMSAEAVIRVSEGSGRPVERRITRDLAPKTALIGIKPDFDDVVPEGTEAAFQVIGLSPELAPQAMDVRWTINRVRTRYQWYQLYGDWNWEPTTTRTRIATGTARIDGAPLNVSAPVEWGRYEVVVERLDGTYVSSSLDFYAGWYAPADASATPDTLDVSLDKPAYRSGDTARLRVVPRNAGLALVTVMSDRLIDMRAVPVNEGENLIDLPVTDEWGAGAYVTASVIRPMDAAQKRNPARALGLSYAPVDLGAKKLAVTIDAPDATKPRGPLDVTVNVDGIAEGAQAYVTLAAVDVGILNLTGFESPDPAGHYFGQRRLGVELRDVYGRLIDGMNGAMGQVRSGGDAGNRMRRQSPPPTEELVAYFSGPLEVDANGQVTASFDIPDFNGTVRLMAVAWTPTAVGSADRDVILRDPIVVTASLPRFLAPGDQSRLLLEIVHTEGPAGRMGLDITADGLALAGAVPSGIDLAEQGKAVLSLPIEALDTGDHSLRVALTTPDGTQLTKTLALGVRANDPVVSQTRRFDLAAGDTFTLDSNVFAGLRPGTGSATVSAGPLAQFDAAGLLSSLDRYPYGCTEQVTSRALPLLYLSGVAEAMGLGGRETIELRVGQAIDRVLTRQASNGAFGLWRAQSGDFWLDAYVSDFLSRARLQGFEVPDIAFRAAMDNLRNRINYAPDFDEGGGDIAYALMVLAREGAASVGDLRYYADVKGGDFTTPMAAAQLGAALASYGDTTRADAMFARAARMISSRMSDESPVWRVDYGTNLRDAAGLLSLAVESGSNVVDRGALAARIGGARRIMSTQERAWSLLAAHALVQDPVLSSLSLNGAPVTGPLVRVVEDRMTAPMAIANSGADTFVTLTTFGVPEVPPEKGGYGYGIDRKYFTLDGTPAEGPVKAGERYVTVLEITPFEGGEARLMVDDPLPAGFEIDNPNLIRGGDLAALDWLDTAEAEHAEFRADRFLAAVDRRSTNAFRLAYIVRAVSPGVYHHPAAAVEDMYRPQYRAQSGAGRLTVIE